MIKTAMASMTVLLILSGRSVAQSSVGLDETFSGARLDEKVWTKGGSNNPVHTVRDGSLRLVTAGMQNQAFIATRGGEFNFFAQPITIAWDLVANKTLAGPYASTKDSKAYAGLSIGADSVDDGGAQLALTAWPEGFPAPKAQNAPWYYTLSFGTLLPKEPAGDNKLSGMPRRIIWTLDAGTWTVTVEGAKFVAGDPQKRTGKHAMKAGDFEQSGFHLLVFTSSHVTSMEPGALHSGSTVYTDRICVAQGKSAPAYAVDGYKDEPSSATVLKDLLGKDYSETGDAQGSKPQYLFGVNYAGGTFRPAQSFVPPTEQSLDYWKSKGVMLMRLPFDWEPLQPKLNEPLDAKYIANLKLSVKMMGDRGMKVLLDMHNYDRYQKQLVGTETVPYAAYADVWKRLAGEFKDNPAVWGYGIMNEPYNTNNTWPTAAQAGIDGIRAVDAKTMIVVAGDGFSGTENWKKNGSLLPTQLKDPSNNLCWEGHCYFDNNCSGKYNFTYEYELNRSNAKLDPRIGIRRIEPFAKWLKENSCKGVLGEFSVPANPDRDPRWLVVLDNVYEYLRKNEIPSTYWAAGTLWTTERCYVIEPYWKAGPEQGKDRPQTQILLKHARLYAGAAGR